MSDRLNDLQRQRALAQEQLAWIDREIAKESGPASAPVASAAAPAPVVPVTVTPVAPAPSDSEAARLADEILSRYQPTAGSAERDTKRGCYLYFAFAVGALVVFAIGAYVVYRKFR